MTKTTLLLPDDLKADIVALSKKEQRSEQEVMRDALRLYVAQHGMPRWPRSIGMADDGSFDSADDEKNLAEHGHERPLPRSIGIASSGRIQSDQVDEWLEQNWERDW